LLELVFVVTFQIVTLAPAVLVVVVFTAEDVFVVVVLVGDLT
jgi:hypothetical protein